MNVLLWVVQVILALLLLAGGGFKVLNPDDVARQIRSVPPAGWRVIGVLEVVGAVLLIVPGVLSWMPALTTFAAAALALENLGLSALYGRYSRKLVAANPLVYAVPLALLAAFVAYGRYALSPLV